MTTLFEQRHKLPPNIRVEIIRPAILCEDETLDEDGCSTPRALALTMEERKPMLFSAEWMEQERYLRKTLSMSADPSARKLSK